MYAKHAGKHVYRFFIVVFTNTKGVNSALLALYRSVQSGKRELYAFYEFSLKIWPVKPL